MIYTIPDHGLDMPSGDGKPSKADRLYAESQALARTLHTHYIPAFANRGICGEPSGVPMHSLTPTCPQCQALLAIEDEACEVSEVTR